jgi:hypothetical protein
LTSVVNICGANVTTIPALIVPVSTLPTGTVPIPPIFYTSCNGNLNGLSLGLFGGLIASKHSINVFPDHHPKLSDFSIMLSPTHPEIGHYCKAFGF